MSTLTQKEADHLLQIQKEFANNKKIFLPPPGRKLEITLVSSKEEERKDFIVNYTKSSINISKRSHHLRTKKIIGLARLDLDGPPHTNPDGEEIGKRHLHIYRENFDLKWASEIPNEDFKNLDDAYETFIDFLKYIKVIELSNINRELFS